MQRVRARRAMGHERVLVCHDGDDSGAKVPGEGKKKNSPIEELNLGLNLRKVVCYHYTNRTLVAIRKANFSCKQR